MAIKFKCPACGQREVVPDEMAGQKTECRQCGRKIRLPGGAAAPTSAAVQSAARDARSSAPAAPEPQPAEAASQIETEVPPTYTCATCGQSFDVADVYDQQGTVICKSCFAAQQAAAVAGGTVESAEAEPQEEPIACASCGTMLRPEQVEEWGGQLMCASCATLAAARPVAPAARRAPVAKRSSPTPWIVGGSVAAAVLGVAVLAFVKLGGSNSNPSAVATDSTMPGTSQKTASQVPSSPTPEPGAPTAAADVLPQLIELRRRGLEQESANDLKGASATYAQLIELGQGVPNASDAIKQQLATAQSALSAIKDRLAPSTPSTTPAVAAAESAAPTASATTAPSPASASTGDAGSAPAAGGNWEQQHAAPIRALLAQAESRLAANDSFKATLIYQQLFQLVGTHLPDIENADLKRQVQAAATARGKLLLQLKSSPESVRLTADTLLASGLAALHESHWQAGLESLADVRALFERNIKLAERARDAKYLMALDGMAVAYLKTKQAPKAGELFEDTAPLGRAVDQDPTREMVINRAAVDIIQRTKAMRAAKSLKAYLEKHPGDAPDEALLNLFGTSLFIAEQHTSGKTKLEEYAVIYKRENDRLEKTRPGEKRWGVEWMSEQEVDRKMAERQKALDEFARYSRQATAAYNDWQHTQELYNTFNAYGVRKASLGQAQAAERTYNGFANAATEARKKIPDMTWLAQIDPVLPPLPAGITAVASATPGDSSGSTGGVDAQQPSVFTIPTITLHDPAPRPGPAETAGDSTASVSPKPPMHIAVPRHALAFPIDHARLVSSADVVGDAKQVRMEDAQGQVYSAHVLARQDALVILELDPGQPRFATYLSLADNFTGGPVQCSCVPQENVFGPQPASLAGQAGPPPAQGPWSVSLADHPRLPGSPLLNEQRQVVGVVIARRDDVRTHLPAVGLAALRDLLAAHSALAAAPSPAPDPMNVLEVTVQEDN